MITKQQTRIDRFLDTVYGFLKGGYFEEAGRYNFSTVLAASALSACEVNLNQDCCKVGIAGNPPPPPKKHTSAEKIYLRFCRQQIKTNIETFRETGKADGNL
jgi:hypothetical protein